MLPRIRLIGLFMLVCSCMQKPKTETGTNLQDSIAETSTIQDEVYTEPDCIYQPSGKQPSDVFPFNVADKIEAVSYPAREQKRYLDPADLIRDGKFTATKISERVRLNGKQTDSLFHLLYDHVASEKTYLSEGSDCYMPHHAILFYQSKKVIGAIEFCFLCHRYLCSFNPRGLPFCGNKFSLLKNYFKWVGIKKNFDFP